MANTKKTQTKKKTSTKKKTLTKKKRNSLEYQKKNNTQVKKKTTSNTKKVQAKKPTTKKIVSKTQTKKKPIIKEKPKVEEIKEEELKEQNIEEKYDIELEVFENKLEDIKLVDPKESNDNDKKLLQKEDKKRKKEKQKQKKEEEKVLKEQKKELKEKKETKEVKKQEEKKEAEDKLKEIPKKIKEKKKKTKNEIKIVKESYKRLSKPIKWIVTVFVICSIILITEGIIFSLYNNKKNRNTVFHDSYNGVSADDSNVVVVGNSDFKHGAFNTYTKGNERGKIIKYDVNGNIIFEKAYDKGIATTFNSVLTTSDGYVVVGTGIFSKEEQKNEAKEAFIIKYDKDGEIIWEKFYQVLTDTSYNKVIEVSDGYIAVGQSIYANMELGNHTTGGGIIVKYDKEGNEQWHNNHGGTKSGCFNDIVQVGDGLYIAGKDGSDSGNLVKYNLGGEYQWHKNYSYTDSFGLTGITYLNNGLYVVGSKKVLKEGITENDDRTTENTDGLLIKYDLDGNIVFEKTFGGSGFERYNTIKAIHNNLYIVGHICSKDAGLKVINDDKEEMTGLIIKYDINGNILKKDTFGGSNNDNLVDIDTDNVSFYVVGYSNSKDGDLKATKSNGKDYYGKVIKLNNRFKKIYIK